MNKEMIISSNDHETRVAILEDDQVVELFVERERSARRRRQHLQGAGLEGPARHAVRLRRHRPRARRRSSTSRTSSAPSRSSSGSKPATTRTRTSRSVRLEDGRRRRGGAAVPAETRPARAKRPVRRGDAARADGGRRGRSRATTASATGREPQIEDLLKEGQDVLVQVVKEPLGTKGARLTSHVVACPAASWCSCRRSITSACRARSSRAKSAAACAGSSASSASSTASPAASSSAPPPRAARRRTSSATCRTSTRSGRRSAQKMEARRAAGGGLPGAEPGRQAAARPADRRLHARSASTTSRSTGGCSRWSSGSCRRSAAGEALQRRTSRSSRSTASRRSSTRRCAARCG